jgi:hypothetical protein
MLSCKTGFWVKLRIFTFGLFHQSVLYYRQNIIISKKEAMLTSESTIVQN